MDIADGNDGWTIFDQAPGALALADENLVILRTNPAFSRLTGRTREELEGSDGYAIMAADRREEARARLSALRVHGEPYALDQRFELGDGSRVWLHAEVSVLRAGGRTHFVAQLTDTTAERRAIDHLRRLADHDHLTGLLNRRRLDEEIERELASVRSGGEAALVLLDVDHFKLVNDRDGPEAGDRLLCGVASTVRSVAGEAHAVARLGGDEFAVLLRSTPADAATRLGEQIVSAVADHVALATVSVGVAPLDGAVRSAQKALHAADTAMYAAKTAGRNRVTVHPRRTAGPSPFDAGTPDEDGTDAGRLLEGLQDVASAPSIDRTLVAVRELLAMDLSFLTRHTDTEQVVVAVDGVPESFAIAVGARMPLATSYCQRILTGQLPAAMPDVHATPVAEAMELTAIADVGAYVSVPVRLSDGSLYGTLCAASHGPRPSLGERDLEFLGVLARLVAYELERDAALREQLALRVETAGTEALISAIEARDRYTGAHSRDVVELAGAVAARLGLGPGEQHRVKQVALLHDIGKLSLPDAILGKEGKLTREEMTIVERHPEDGARIVAAIPELAHLAAAIRAEHERWDGAGYPDGLAGAQIPVASRIVFVCDAWDAMTSDRPYRAKMSHAKALNELTDGAGSQFCAECVDALLAILDGPGDVVAA